MTIQYWNHKSTSFTIDYERFRQMEVGIDTLTRLNKNLNKEPYINLFKYPYTSYDYFTMKMIVSDYNLLKNRDIRKKHLNKLLDTYSTKEKFVKLKSYYIAVLDDIINFPLKPLEEEEYYSFTDTWNESRSFGGDRKHEGCDIFTKGNVAGKYPVISMTAGIIEQMGWLTLGGYRIGIRSDNGGYFYYAHLDSFVDGLNIGDRVKANDMIGFVGDSGYGEEGTRGKFVVHLHMGIYVDGPNGEMSVNPYYILTYLNDRKS